jgi:N-acyl-D-aspartate/D-glutamate deacylase
VADEADLLLRGGTVIDGSGMRGFTADVEIRGGRIARVGRLSGAPAREVLDVEGLVVCPGFVDIHTHYDAQLHFEPTASPSPQHGVTTVVMGNCGFTLAPARPGDVGWLVQMLSRVEGMSAEALSTGVPFPGGGVGDFLRGLEGRIGVNAAMFVGHAAVRRWVMGDDASTRPATEPEIAAMQDLVRAGMRDGAIGFSTSQLDIHADHEGRPVPPNLASPEEIVALAATLAEFDHGVLEILPQTFFEGYSDRDRALVLDMARASGGKPVNLNIISVFPGSPDGWRRNMAVVDEAAREGLRLYPMFTANPKGIHFALSNTFMLDEMPVWRDTLTLPLPERIAALRDPAVRARLQRDLDEAPRSFRFTWDVVKVKAVEHETQHAWLDRTVAELAAERAQDPLDCFLDLALEGGLETIFATERPPLPGERETTFELMRHPSVMPGSSDGGAHLLTFCGADYTTRVLAEAVPDALTIEQAVAKLTSAPAAAFGFWDRGLLRPGFAADITVFDPTTVAVGALRFVRDFPTGAGRLVFDSIGYHAVIVNGRILLRDGVDTGARAGAILRP